MAAGDAPHAKIELPQETVFRKILENGLVILAKEAPPSDLMAIDITIRAGSATEGEYLGSGISHLTEHMVFKGTSSKGQGTIEREMKSYGGFLNGSVSHDITDFHVTVPIEHFDRTLALLKEMLLNAVFDNTELEKEKSVISKEIKMNEDEPQSALAKALYRTAYLRHPYRFPVIGYEDKLARLDREDLMRYYQRMYVPNRMVIAVAGGGAEKAAETIEREFKNFRAPYYGEPVVAAEPPQIAKRLLDARRPMNLSYLAMGFHSTGVLDRDIFAMDVLAIMLGIGDSSRLNDTLVKEKQLAYYVGAWNYVSEDPGLMVVTAILDDKKIAPAESEILAEIQKVRDGLPDTKELERAKRIVLSDFIFSRQTLEEQASDMSKNEILTGDYDFSRRYVAGIQSVTGEDVRRVAGKYLREENLTTIRLLPVAPGLLKPGSAQAAGRVTGRTSKHTLPNGLRLLLREDPKTPTVSVTIAFLGGLAAETEKTNGISSITSALLLKGTPSRKEAEIKGAIERLGGNIDSFSGMDSFGLTLEVLKGDLDTALDIVKDALINSDFPEEEIAKMKLLTLASIKDEDGDIFEQGVLRSRKVLFGPHPYGMRYKGEETTVMSLTRDDIAGFRRKYCVPANMVISVSGDIEEKAVLERLRSLFGVMDGAAGPDMPGHTVKPASAKTVTYAMPREESLVVMAFNTVGIKDKDIYAFEVLGSIVSGHSGRLFEELRDKRSLAYTLGCLQRHGALAGYLLLYVATVKDKIAETEKALAQELKTLREKAVSDEDLLFAKRELIASRKGLMQTNGFLSLECALNELYGNGFEEVYNYEKGIGLVTKEDIKNAAARYMTPDACVEVVIAPDGVK
ncbi:MAG: pitrilysin family protein [Candidatus Omnitrophota bacterium]